MRWAMVVGAIALSTGPAAAHEWYAPDCCSGQDCRMLTDSEVKELPRGWGTPDGVVGYTDARIRPSQDGRFHVCTVQPASYGYELNRMEGNDPPSIRCLYVPPRGM